MTIPANVRFMFSSLPWRNAGMETTATILHADLDAFYASVEQLLDPSLRGKPIAVGGGVVLAASYEAKAFGVHGGMPGRRARELCPQLIFVGGHFKEYQRLGDAAIKVLGDFTPLVERISIDEAFRRCRRLHPSVRPAGRDRASDPAPRACRARSADLGRRGAHQASGEDRLAGRQARRAGRRRSRYGAGVPARPAGRADVGRRPGRPRRGWRRSACTRSGNWPRRRDARSSDLLGPAAGEKLSALAWNRDPREIRTHRRARSAGAQSALGRKPAEERVFRPTLRHLADRIGARLRAKSLSGPDRHRPRSLRRPPRGHALRDARCADLGDGDPCRDRRGSWCARRSPIIPRRRPSRCWRSRCRISRPNSSCSSSCRSGLRTRRAGPAAERGMARSAADRAVDTIRDRFGWEAVGYGSVALGSLRSVPDAFRELAEHDL